MMPSWLLQGEIFSVTAIEPLIDDVYVAFEKKEFLSATYMDCLKLDFFFYMKLPNKYGISVSI